MRILVVDDDEILVDVLTNSLSKQRHVVDTAEDGKIGWEYVQTGEYELVLLDVNMPGLDGVSLCEKMRSEGYDTPILLMTAKNESQDRIQGLDAGADDYLTKPLDLGELSARVRALSRRGTVAITNVLNVNGLMLDPSSCQVSYQEKPIKLTAKEYSLLEIFLRNPSRVFSRAQILDKIWTFDDPPLEDSVKAHIKGLRKKLKKAGVVDWIENVYGIGYRLNPKVSEPQPQETSDTASVEQEFDRKMAQMWLKYQNKMAERLNVLKDAVAQLKQTNLSTELQADAEKAAHKLAGVLGMFSRDTGTSLARQIETLLQNNPNLNPQQQEEFFTLVQDLDSLLALDESAIETAIAPTLLFISQDSRPIAELQHLAKTQGLAWQQEQDLTLGKVWLEKNSPELVLVDLETANRSEEYLAFISELKSHTPAIPIIALSELDSLENRLSLNRAGVSSFLAKPVTPSEIWKTTSQLIAQNGANSFASVLIVDDDPVFLAAVRSILDPWGIKVSTVETPADFWQVLPATQPDLVILDVEMPKISGIELCQALRSDLHWQELPVLFLTAKQDAETIRQIFEIGGDDYISKPVVGAELIARINNRLERSRILHRLATQDPITGLLNRSQSSRELESLLQQAQAQNQPFSLAVIQISELRAIIHKYGHPTSDRILTKWGKTFSAALNQNEVLAYWDNGDFIIGLPGLDQARAKDRLDELLAILRKQVFAASTNNNSEIDRFQVEFKVSISEFLKDGETLNDLYRACNTKF